MFCKKCGNVLPDYAAVCDKCGTPTGVSTGGKSKTNKMIFIPIGIGALAVIIAVVLIFALKPKDTVKPDGGTPQTSSQTDVLPAGGNNGGTVIIDTPPVSTPANSDQSSLPQSETPSEPSTPPQSETPSEPPTPPQSEAPSEPSAPSQNNGTPDEVVIAGQSYSTSLIALDLSKKGLKNSDIADLKYFTKLKRIMLQDNDLTDISVLENISTLFEINAENNNISNISFMKNMPNLRIVVINNNPIGDISCFSSIPELEKLWIVNTNVTSLNPLSNCTNMTELGVNGCAISSIDAVNGMTKLEMLHAAWCGLTDLSPVSGCTALQTLYLNNNSFTDYSALAKLNNLNTVVLDGSCVMTDAIAKTFNGMKIARYLSLQEIEMTDEQINIIFDGVELFGNMGYIEWSIYE